MLEYVFNGMVFLILGLQLPGIISESLIRAENDPLVDTGSLLLDVIWIYGVNGCAHRLALADASV